jgi:daunorubicin resistance ABC transporter ATP-binding subunit
MDAGNGQPPSNSIIIDRVSKKFGDFAALDSISMQIGRGEIFGLLGPNGAGKTTLLNILCGLSRPTEGKVSIFGMTFRDHHSDIRKLLGYVPQETALYEHLTAEENLMFHARFYGVAASQRKSRVDKALHLAQLESRRRSKVKEFSGGMKRRLAIVRSLIHDPSLLMLDEPSLGIDVQSRVEIWDRIKEMKDKRTIIITTNYMEEADYLCDRVAILDHGRLIALGSPDELKRSHLGEVVELALKDAPQSFLDNLAQVFAGITENFITDELAERGGGWVKVSLRVPDASSKVAKIIEAARNHGVETSEVNVRAPSLNDVFIELTGKRLRE